MGADFEKFVHPLAIAAIPTGGLPVLRNVAFRLFRCRADGRYVPV